MNGAESPRINHNAPFGLGLPILRVAVTFYSDLERVLVRVLHHFDDVLNGGRLEYRCGNPMKEVALIDGDSLP